MRGATHRPLRTRPSRRSRRCGSGRNYSVDFVQRSVLFWDTMRLRGNQWLEHEAAGKPPVLAYQYEVLADARTFERPANYALVRIVPPRDVTIDDRLRPYVIIDPRAGHGPGIGGFKEDSEVGVALRAGHPVYFVIFYPEPCPGRRWRTCATPKPSSCASWPSAIPRRRGR